MVVVCGLDWIGEPPLIQSKPSTKKTKPNQELSCDYTLFEFEAGEAGIQQCQCGAGDECLGQVLGFKVRERYAVVCLIHTHSVHTRTAELSDSAPFLF